MTERELFLKVLEDVKEVCKKHSISFSADPNHAAINILDRHRAINNVIGSFHHLTPESDLNQF